MASILPGTCESHFLAGGILLALLSASGFRADSSAAAPAPARAPFDAEAARVHQSAWAAHLGTRVEITDSIGMTMVLIPPGEFLMGSSDAQVEEALAMAALAQSKAEVVEGIRDGERPQRRVTVPRPFLIGRTEVTWDQFRRFVEATGYRTEAEQFGFGNSAATTLTDDVPARNRKLNWRTPGYEPAGDFPVTEITWNDAVAFCRWLSEQEKLAPCYRHEANEGWTLVPSADGYRLPTEVEWEYACRAGTTTHYYFGDDPAVFPDYGWCVLNSDGHPHPVASKKRNAFGLFDMHGNAREWCHDWYHEKWYGIGPAENNFGPASGRQRVARGSNWSIEAVNCRSAFRLRYLPTLRFSTSGFRVARSLVHTSSAESSAAAEDRATLQVVAVLRDEAALAGAHDIEVRDGLAYIAGKGFTRRNLPKGGVFP